MSENILQVKNLTVSTGTGTKKTDIVNNISFTIERGETFVLLGESGSGKSITALSIMRLLPAAIKISDGSVILHTTNLFQLPENKMRKIRGAKIGMIFQEPQTSLNPVLTAGQQISETLRQHDNLSKKQCIKRSIELLDAVGIPDAERRINEYPHQFSGGMKQRIMIAIALAGKPDLLIADEPTTALDVTIQAQVLNLLRKLQSETGMSILFITHDIGVAAQMADHIAVMQNGSIVELKTKKELFSNPENSYTQKLFDAIPSWEKRTDKNEIEEIERTERSSLIKVKELKVLIPSFFNIFIISFNIAASPSFELFIIFGM